MFHVNILLIINFFGQLLYRYFIKAKEPLQLR